MTASERLLRDLLSRGAYLERFSLSEARQLAEILDRAHEAVLGRIAATRGEATRPWLQEVASGIKAIYDEAGARIASGSMARMRGLAVEEGAWVDSATRGALPVELSVSTTIPGADQVWAAVTALPASGGYVLGQLMEALGVAANTAVVEALQIGFANGDTNDELVRRLRGRVVRRASWRTVDGKRTYIPGQYEGGVMAASTRQAELLARTATMHVANVARNSYFEANADIIKGFQRVETLDMDTCIICGADDGHIYKPGEPRPKLPVHPNCRGTYAPVFKSWRELGVDADEIPPGTRASMDGQVPENQTFDDRLRKMGAARRRAILGPNRARLYEDGMPLEAMVQDKVRLIPLKELRS